MVDGVNQLNATFGSWELTRTHLYKEDAKAVDVHLGCLTTFGGSVHWTTRILGLQLTLEVSSAVVRDLCQPASIGSRLEENVGTAEVPVDHGVRGHVVEVVESTGHVRCDGEDVFQWKKLSWTSVDQISEASWH